jgi:hypothetical protein
MATEEPHPFPRRWAEMSFDTKLFFAFHCCILLMFMVGGALSTSIELSVALGLASVAVVASLVHRYREAWHWRGAGFRQVLGAIGGIALIGLMFLAVGQFGAYTNPHLLPWFIAGTGIAAFNALVSLRLVRRSQAEFVADVQWNPTVNQQVASSSSSAAPKPTALNVVRNAAAGALTGYGFISFFIFIWLDIQWTHLAPMQPDAAHGLLYVHNEHGSYVYFSAFQATTCALMFWTSIPLAFVGMFVAPKKNVHTTARWYAARMTFDKDDPAKVSDWAFWIAAFLTPPFLYFLGSPLVTLLNNSGFVAHMG